MLLNIFNSYEQRVRLCKRKPVRKGLAAKSYDYNNKPVWSIWTVLVGALYG
jgi:hypothetical protein